MDTSSDDTHQPSVVWTTDDYADKWCDWSSDGKVCTWKKETHYRDGSIRRETTREEYDDRGLLRLVHHYDDESNYDSLERLYYDAGGELTRKSTRTVFKSKEKSVQGRGTLVVARFQNRSAVSITRTRRLVTTLPISTKETGKAIGS